MTAQSMLLTSKLNLWGAQSECPLPCKPELSPTAASWQQPGSCSASLQPGTTQGVDLDSTGAHGNSFNLLLRQLSLQHHREVSQARAEFERQLADLRQRAETNSWDDVHTAAAEVPVELSGHNSTNETPPDVTVAVDDQANGSIALPKELKKVQLPEEKSKSSFGSFAGAYSEVARRIVKSHFWERLTRIGKSGWFGPFARQKTRKLPRSRLHRLIHKVEHSQLFDSVCALMIISNATLMGISTDIAARNTDPDDLPQFFTYAHWTFSSWFFFEVALRMLSNGVYQFFSGKEWGWNIFDFVMVATDWVEVLATLFSDRDSAVVQKLAAIRMLRMLRVIRTIKVIRLARFFKELRMMVFSVLRSGLLLLWSMILLGLIIFIFGVFLTQNVTWYLFDAKDVDSELIDKLQTYFGSLTFAAYVLFQCMSGGISWGEISDPLLEVHWSNGLVLCFFIFFTVFAVLNVIAGIFVETAIRSAQADRHEVIQEAMHFEDTALFHMQQFLHDTDMDRSGTITLKELKEQLENPQMRTHLKHLGIEVSDATSIFRLLDVDRTGEICVQEFLFGCLEMQGSAKSIDLITLIHENRRLKADLANFFTFVKETLAQQGSFQQKLESLFFA